MDIKTISLHILTHTHSFGRKKILDLIERFGSAEAVVDAGFDPKKNLLFKKWPVGSYKLDLELAENQGIKLISYMDLEYPKNLLAIPDFPLLLYINGELLVEDQKSVGIIGTRNATLYGKQTAELFAKQAAESGVCVVSGLARGIDTSAHIGALNGKGRTLAVVGSGLAALYPKENLKLADQIAESGAVISEYPMNRAPHKGSFPQRNRMISALSKAVCLIESPLKGGGMLTMQIAEKHKKACFALPGRVDWPTFRGNHFLIKEKKAELVENAHDLLKEFEAIQSQALKTESSSCLTPDEHLLLDRMPVEEKTIEELVLLTQLPMMQLNVFLTRLVLKKVVKKFPGKIYKKIANG